MLAAQLAHTTSPVTAAVASRITLKVPASAIAGSPVAIDAQTTPVLASTDWVQFRDNGANIGPLRHSTTGRYSWSQTFALGTHSITAITNTGVVSAPATLTVTQAGTGTSTMSLSSTPASPIQGGTPVNISIIVTGSTGLPTPSGSVTVKNGATVLSSGRTLTNGQVSVPVSALPLGTNTITATYSGDASYAPVSGTMTITVNPSANDKLVQHWYTDFLGYQDPNGEAYWSSQLAKGVARYSIAYTFTQTEAYRTSVITALYQTLLHRAPDPGGLSFWVGQLARGKAPEWVAASMAASGEAFTNAGSVSQFVTTAYQVLLGRPPDGPGGAYWTNYLNNGGQRWQMTLDFTYSPEWAGKVVTGMYGRFHLGTPGSPLDPNSGNSYWSGQMVHGMTDDQVAANLASSAQYANWAAAN